MSCAKIARESLRWKVQFPMTKILKYEGPAKSTSGSVCTVLILLSVVVLTGPSSMFNIVFPSLLQKEIFAHQHGITL